MHQCAYSKTATYSTVNMNQFSDDGSWLAVCMLVLTVFLLSHEPRSAVLALQE